MIVYALLIHQWHKNRISQEDDGMWTDLGRVFLRLEDAQAYCKNLTQYRVIDETRIFDWKLVRQDSDWYMYNRVDDNISEEDDDDYDAPTPYCMEIDIIPREVISDENPLYKIEVVKEKTK